ncbi:MAG: glycosyltransferase [Solobacterium sp.]|nr:glycosyltransferase [Solobacterium sp.]
MIKTSVIIPVYNTIEYLAECIDSVLAQTQKEIEIILVDDGSDDGSLEMCQEYAEKYPFITLLRQTHEYQGTARNRGLRIAKGRYIYFMDSDDAIKPDLFAKCYQACEERNLDFVIFDAHGFVYDENDHELVVPEDIWDRTTLGIEDRNYSGAEFWDKFYNDHGLLYVCWLHYIRKDYLLENHLFYEEKTYFEDNDWILRMYIHAQNLYYIPEELHLHRWRRGSNMLGGFTPGLLHGCIRMHDVLLKIYEDYPQKEYRRMSRDVIDLNIERFLRLQEIEPTPEYTDLLDVFIPHLKAQIFNQDLEDDLYSFCERTCINLCEGTKNWPGNPCKELKELLKKAYTRRIFLGDPEARVVIYGTGIVSKRFLNGYSQKYGQPEAKLVFMNTVVSEKSFEGYPVISVDQLKEYQPDAVIIASTKYKDEMIQTVHQILGQDIRYICVN